MTVDLRLNAIVDPERSGGHDLADLARLCAQGGATLIQLRDKLSETRAMVETARAIKKALAPFDVPLVINDRVDVALAAGADGVHVGQDDMAVEDARKLLGRDAIIGLSIKTVAEAQAAPVDLIDYVGSGGVYVTGSKQQKNAPIGPEGLGARHRRAACARAKTAGLRHRRHRRRQRGSRDRRRRRRRRGDLSAVACARSRSRRAQPARDRRRHAGEARRIGAIMAKIAISYRRSDSQDITGRIFDRLVQHYGKDTVFRDIDSIQPGIDFRTQIAAALGTTDVLLVVLGPAWLGRDKDNTTRIGNETDPVRIEVETALKRDIPIIPILVGGTRMPEVNELPQSLRDFAYRHAVTVDGGRDFDHHMDGLIRSLHRILHVPQGGKSGASQAADSVVASPRFSPALYGIIGGLAVAVRRACRCAAPPALATTRRGAAAAGPNDFAGDRQSGDQ